MKGTIVASRYAKSLLELSIEKNNIDKINEDMVQLSEICKESKELTNLLKNPIVNSDKKANVFDKLFKGKVDDLSLSFIQLITKNKRENLLPNIAYSFTLLYKEHKHILDVELVSAQPIDDATKTKIIEKVKTKYDGYTINLIEKTDVSLIGGFIIKIKDKQLDASIASQLTNLKNILLN
ncbi:MAG TPA: ATP synthase F1 subunit delta [Crocinitomix sp.]|nr:ATP synthase F1 subunit delta [Crocinitomix sp.]